MPTLFLFRHKVKGTLERYPQATVYDTSYNLLGDAISSTFRGTAWDVQTQHFKGFMAFDSPLIRYLPHDPPAPLRSGQLDPEALCCACPWCEEESEAGHGAGDSDGHRFCYACELAGCSEDTARCGGGEDEFCGCQGKGWKIFNEDPESERLGEVQACDCGILPDDEAAYTSAAAAGLLIDAQGHVLAEPWGVYADQARRQSQLEALCRKLFWYGRLLGSCPPGVQFFALKNRVFCDRSTIHLDYAGELEDFEQWIAEGKIPGFRPA